MIERFSAADRIVSRSVLQAADEARALVLVLHVDGRLVRREEGGGPEKVLVQVVLPLIRGLKERVMMMK